MGLLNVLGGDPDVVRPGVSWRRCRVSKSWHSWQVLLSFPSGISTLSLPHSQVRFRISSAGPVRGSGCCPVGSARQSGLGTVW